MGGEGIEGGEGTKGEREVKDGKKIHSVRPSVLSLAQRPSSAIAVIRGSPPHCDDDNQGTRVTGSTIDMRKCFISMGRRMGWDLTRHRRGWGRRVACSMTLISKG